MEYFPAVQGIEGFLDKVQEQEKLHGFTLHAVEEKESGLFIGFIGLVKEDLDLPFMPVAEINWRLSSKFWGKGLATEGARAVLHYAFTELALPEVVSYTAKGNRRSIRVMEKIGLHHDPMGDFNHPRVTNKSPLRAHILYRITQQQYACQGTG